LADTDLTSLVRREAREAPSSGIVEVAFYARNRGADVIPLYVGEGDLVTPDFIRAEAALALEEGETFYTWQRGIPKLREALARYITRLYSKPVSSERFFVTGSGMHALQTAARIVAGTGDEVIVPSPAWPNLAAAAGIAGARAVEVPMHFSRNGWSLDIDRIEATVSERTRAILINSPANPTGWVASRDDLNAVLTLARRHGLWIIADEIYGRFVYDGPAVAPSFRDVMEEGDRVIFIQTFSKNWAMTGWRMGWIECDPALGETIENLVQYSTSGVAAFMQRAGVAALDHGEAFVADQIARAKRGRDIVCQGLAATGAVSFAPPQGSFYFFFSIDGVADTRRYALDLVDKAKVGVAPGTAFGAGGEAFFRLCFLRKSEDIEEAVRRLARVLERAAA
jgi:aspartate/methionine/tyrosine aminotransferase